MKIAQEVRAGNVIMIGKDPMVVQKAEFSKSGRNASVVKMKLQEPALGRRHGDVYRADEKFDVDPARAQGSHVFVFRRSDVRVHGQRIQPARRREGQHRRRASTTSRTASHASSRSTRARRSRSSCRTSVVREVAYTEPAVKGDTSGKVTKPAKLASGFEVPVPLFVTTGDKIEIDTRTGEYRRRV